MCNFAAVKGYGDDFDDQYEREMGQSYNNDKTMADYKAVCRRIAEDCAVDFYKADLESKPETMAEKQSEWEDFLIQEANQVGANEEAAMRLHIDYRWQDFVDYSFTIKTARAHGAFKGYPEITTD